MHPSLLLRNKSLPPRGLLAYHSFFSETESRVGRAILPAAVFQAAFLSHTPPFSSDDAYSLLLYSYFFDVRSIAAGRGMRCTGFCFRSRMASATARSNWGSWPLITSAGVYSTSTSGVTPSFSTAHLPERS